MSTQVGYRTGHRHPHRLFLHRQNIRHTHAARARITSYLHRNNRDAGDIPEGNALCSGGHRIPLYCLPDSDVHPASHDQAGKGLCLHTIAIDIHPVHQRSPFRLLRLAATSLELFAHLRRRYCPAYDKGR